MFYAGVSGCESVSLRARRNERAEPGSNFFFPVKKVPGQIRLVPRQGDKTCVLHLKVVHATDPLPWTSADRQNAPDVCIAYVTLPTTAHAPPSCTLAPSPHPTPPTHLHNHPCWGQL